MEKISVIELNETSLKLSIFKVNGSKYSLALADKQPLKFGEEISRDELLSPLMKNKILDILKIYRKLSVFLPFAQALW